MIDLRTKAFDLPLKHVFTISRGSVSVQPTLIVQVAAGSHYGYGEATTNEFYGATIDNMNAALERVRPILKQAEIDDLDSVLQSVANELERAPFARCALDLALHDLWGKQQGRPLHEIWGLDLAKSPQSNFTIGVDKIPVMVEKMLEEPDWPYFKIKLGAGDDLQIVRELRKHTDKPFRVDANCGWDADHAIEFSQELKSLGVEFIEQPLPPEDTAGMKRLFEASALPLIADESCAHESDVARCDGLFHGINIKLVKCGGIAPARRMIDEARRRGLQVMMGCMTESTVGISAIAQLLPLLDYVDMDGAALLASDIATGAKVVNGTCHWPEGAGSGIALLEGPL